MLDKKEELIFSDKSKEQSQHWQKEYDEEYWTIMKRESQKTRSLSRCFLKGVQIVDPMKDEGIWLTIDSACNTSCHGTPWRKNMI